MDGLSNLSQSKQCKTILVLFCSILFCLFNVFLLVMVNSLVELPSDGFSEISRTSHFYI